MLKQVQNHDVNRFWCDAAELDVQSCFWCFKLAAAFEVLKNSEEKPHAWVLSYQSYMTTIGIFPKFSEQLFCRTPENCCALCSLRYCLFSTHTSTFAYQGIKNVSFSENFACVLNGWPLGDHSLSTCGKPSEKLTYLTPL